MKYLSILGLYWNILTDHNWKKIKKPNVNLEIDKKKREN